jgi:phospholipase A1
LSLFLFAAEPSPVIGTLNLQGVKDTQARSYIRDWSNETFGLSPYRPNYVLPLSYSSKPYRVYTPHDGTYMQTEAELQVSFKFALAQNLLGLNEKYYAAYTQRSFWQVYKKSSPFRETNYSPELFVTVPLGTQNTFGPKLATLGFWHYSNGQGNIEKSDNVAQYPELVNRSRSLNRLYAKLTFQHNALVWDAMVWYPFGHYDDDNPDIMDYIGYGGIRAMYFYRQHLFSAYLRGNPLTQKGSIELTYSHPAKIKGTYFFGKLFTGYGESLIDYNHKNTKISVGVSFSR